MKRIGLALTLIIAAGSSCKGPFSPDLPDPYGTQQPTFCDYYRQNDTAKMVNLINAYIESLNPTFDENDFYQGYAKEIDSVKCWLEMQECVDAVYFGPGIVKTIPPQKCGDVIFTRDDSRMDTFHMDIILGDRMRLVCRNDGKQIAEHANDFLPLSIGNSWTLKSVSDGHGNWGTITISVIGDTIWNGKTYWVLGRASEKDTTIYRSFVRYDTLEEILYITDGEHETIFDTKKQNGETYTIDMPIGMSVATYTVTVTLLDTLATPAGTVRKCIDFYFNAPEVCDEESGITFAKGIGYVRSHGAWGRDYRLVSYTIH